MSERVEIYGGVDTHRDVHVAAVVDAAGRVLGSESFAAEAAGYRQMVAWLRSKGGLVRVGVEGTGSYGAGLARYVTAAGIEVVEVNRPNRQLRRQRGGKSDSVDAEAAARAAASGQATSVPKSGVGPVECLRMLLVARRLRGQGPHPGRQPQTHHPRENPQRRSALSNGASQTASGPTSNPCKHQLRVDHRKSSPWGGVVSLAFRLVFSGLGLVRSR